MLWVLANKKTGVVHDFTEFSTARKALQYRDQYLPQFKQFLEPYNLEMRRWATKEDL